MILWSASDLPPVPLQEVERLRLENVALTRELLIARRDALTRQIISLDERAVEITGDIFKRAGVSPDNYDISMQAGALVARGKP